MFITISTSNPIWSNYALTDEGYTLKRVHCVAFPFSTSGNSWQWSRTVLLSFIYSSCQHFWLLWMFLLINVKSDSFPRFSATPLSPSWCDDISAENRHGLKQLMKEFAYREYQNTTINQWTFKACLTTIIFIYISTLNPHIIPFVLTISESIFGRFLGTKTPHRNAMVSWNLPIWELWIFKQKLHH